jgi:hypothetical protein
MSSARMFLDQSLYLRVAEVFEEYGPMPRLCIEFLSDPEELESYKDEVCDAISDIKVEQLEKLCSDATSLTMNAVSHKLFLISRKQPEVMDSKVIVAPMTEAIEKKLARRFQNLQQIEQLRLYKFFARTPDSRAVAGLFIESICQRRLQEGVTINIVPMVKLDKDRKGGKLEKERVPQWHSSHVHVFDSILDASRQRALLQSRYIDINPSQSFEFQDALSSVSPRIFYVPVATNHEALDSFILLNEELFVFQFTVGTHHGIKPGLIKFLKRCSGVPTMDKWTFVFVIPDNTILKCPQPWSLELRKLRLWSTVMVI